jgi:hypothetical protein
MDHDQQRPNQDLRADVQRLLGECRDLLKLTDSVAKRLKELSDRLSTDQNDRPDAE